MMSACSGSEVSSMGPSSLRTSTILSESYSFIWQPKVRMKSLRAGPWAGRAVVSGAGVGCGKSVKLRYVSWLFAVTGVDPGGQMWKTLIITVAKALGYQGITRALRLWGHRL